MASSYWEGRAAARQAVYDRYNAGLISRMNGVYSRAATQLDTDIGKIFATFERKSGLTPQQARQILQSPVNPQLILQLQSRISALPDGAVKRQLQTILRADAYRARISRLDAIKASARVGVMEAAETQIGAIAPHLRGIAGLGYSHSLFDVQKATSAFQGSGIPDRQLREILQSRWSGQNYSRRVWTDANIMAGRLESAMSEMATIGKLSDPTLHDIRGDVDVDAWRRQIKSKFKDEWQFAKYVANRLIRTESAYIANEATAIAYEECEIEQYEFIATLDRRTSEVCQAHDGLTDPATGKPYLVSKREVGKNYPPLHPHCRSSVAPVLETQDITRMKRRARRADGKTELVPRDMKYQEWKRWQDDGAPPDIAAWRAGAKPPVAVKPAKPVKPKAPPKPKTAPPPKYQPKPNSNMGNAIGKQHYDQMDNIVMQTTHEDVRAIWKNYEQSIKIGDANYKGTAHYRTLSKQININIAKDAKGSVYQTPFETMFHEGAHAIDAMLGQPHGALHYSSYYKNGAFGDTIRTEVDDWVKAVDAQMKKDFAANKGNTQWLFDNGYLGFFDRNAYDPATGTLYGKAVKHSKDKAYKAIARQMSKDHDILARANLSDIVEGATNARMSFGAGHGKKYWQRPHALSTEAFAEMFASKMANPESYAVLQKYLPKSTQVFDEMIAAVMP